VKKIEAFFDSEDFVVLRRRSRESIVPCPDAPSSFPARFAVAVVSTAMLSQKIVRSILDSQLTIDFGA
jgi:hypothetical protein